MFDGMGREQLRGLYVTAWRKYQAGESLEPLEQQIAQLVAVHPEYHGLLEGDAEALREELSSGDAHNPFLHMGMHLAIRDQVGMDRPAGIAAIYQALVRRLGDLEAEHAMMECLGPVLWEAGRSGRMPDEMAYLECLKKL